VIGTEIISPVDFLCEQAGIIKYHHERYDGRGYPEGLTGEEIPLGARIVAVADAYKAMTAKRIYRPAISPTNALEGMKRCAGQQFDPKIVEVFEHLFLLQIEESMEMR
jgi:HD-GYP domain-containing protein (c-di-GMP phosphodiesterase class II)